MGIKELTLMKDEDDPPMIMSNDFSQSYGEARKNLRVYAQPLEGSGHSTQRQHRIARRYRLVIIGVNQAGFLTHVHRMLMHAGFRIFEGEMHTIRGSDAHNKYSVAGPCFPNHRCPG